MHRSTRALYFVSVHSVVLTSPPAQLRQSDGDEERKGVFVSDEEEHELQGSKVGVHGS